MREELVEVCKGKKVQICSHWDVDGVCSAALIYHLLRGTAAFVKTKTKGIPFLITQEDIDKESEVIICTDILLHLKYATREKLLFTLTTIRLKTQNALTLQYTIRQSTQQQH